MKASLPVLFLFAASAALAQLDRHPELKSRAVAWTEYDGSFLLDTTSRAEAFDLYWSVMRAPYQKIGWTGSVATKTPGTTSDAWRYREYAQLNAYRALVGLSQLEEYTDYLDEMQEGALVMALNQRYEHRIDPTWLGYTEAAKLVQASSNLSTRDAELLRPEDGYADRFIHDAYSDDPIAAGHRKDLMQVLDTRVAIGGSITGTTTWVNLHTRSDVRDWTHVPKTAFSAWPGPGYVAKAFLRPRPSNPPNVANFRWLFNSPWEGAEEYDFSKCVITATLDGQPLAVINPQKHQYNSTWTWEFAPGAIPSTGDNDVTITITGAIVTVPRTFTYTVHLFDEKVQKVTTASPATPLVNLSTRGTIGPGERQMIAGFTVEGDLPVRVAVRAQGPSLQKHGVSNTAKKPRLHLYDSTGKKLGENGGWKLHPNWRLMQGYGVAPDSDTEPGMVMTLWPGLYTVIVSDDEDANGVGIVEAFNIDGQSLARLTNVSTRATIGSDESSLIAGFIIKDTPRTLVFRTQGPGLVKHGIAGAVDDTRLKIVAQSDGHTVAENDDWTTDLRNARLQSDLSYLAPSDDAEAALIVTLQPGAYTALVSAKQSPGVGIVEVFDVPPSERSP